MVMASAMMATAVVAASGGYSCWLAGAGQAVDGGVGGLGARVLPGALQYLQLYGLLTSGAPKSHPAFSRYCVHPGWLQSSAPLGASGTWWLLRGEASLDRESTF